MTHTTSARHTYHAHIDTHTYFDSFELWPDHSVTGKCELFPPDGTTYFQQRGKMNFCGFLLDGITRHKTARYLYRLIGDQATYHQMSTQLNKYGKIVMQNIRN